MRRQPCALLACVAALALAGCAQGQNMPYHPPMPQFEVQPWETPPVGGGLPPEPLVYHSNVLKIHPSIAAGIYSPLAAAHSYPDAASPWFPYTPPHKLPRSLPGPSNQLPLMSPETTMGGAYLPHTYVPGAVYPQGFGHPAPGSGMDQVGAQQKDDSESADVPGQGNGASSPVDAGVTAPKDGTNTGATEGDTADAPPPASMLELGAALPSRHTGLSAYKSKRKQQLAALQRWREQMQAAMGGR
mmetsp:Transcript_17629/g.56538  ORF Transcript_17629/g.56538 Transcript_17629/m.56538 type:complete len:244 (-) Transcript_17629:138-869(-)